MRSVLVAIAWAAAAAGVQAAALPAELAAALRGAAVRGTPTAWCELASRPPQPKAFAVLFAATTGGEYRVVQAGRPPHRLAAFEGAGELACYTPQQARELNRSIAGSQTIQGALRPRWNSTVVCAFTSHTTATCWQRSPTGQRYVTVGGWST